MRKTHIAAAMAVLTLAGAGAAIAQQAPRAARADANGDGRVSQAEFVGQRVQRLTAADANRDGSVTPEEMRAVMQARMAERQAARFDQLDTDRNGSLSRAEFTARPARAEGAEHRGGMRGHHRMGRHGGARGEHAQARGPVVIAEAQAKTEQAFARLDANRDGYVTAEERRAGMQAMRAERRAARPAAAPAN